MLIKQQGRLFTQRGRKRILGFVLVGALSIFVLLPLVFLIVGSLSKSGLPKPFSFTLNHWVRAFLDPKVYGLLGTSVLFSLGSLLVACAFAIPLAWVIERTTIPHKSLMRVLILASTGVPALLTALAWTLLASPRIGALNAYLPFTLDIYSFWGMCFVQGIAAVPLIFLMISPAMRNLDTSLEEAGRMSSGFLTVIGTITLGLMRPAVLAALIFAFILGLLSFDVPAIIGIPADIYVLSSEIFFATSGLSIPSYGYASAIALFTLVVGIVLTIAYLRATVAENRFATVTGKLSGARYAIGRTGRLLTYFWFGLFVLVAVVLPVFALTWTSLMPHMTQIRLGNFAALSFDNFVEVFRNPRIGDSIRNTVVIASIAATVATGFAALASWYVVRSRIKWSKVIDLLAFIPLVIPGIALGLALRFTVLSIEFVAIYGTIWVLVIAYSVEALPLATRNLNTGITQIHPELEEAAKMDSGSFPTIFRTILLPLLLPTVVFVWLWTFLRGLREFSTAVLLATPKNQVLSITLYSSYDLGELTVASAVGMIMLVLVLPVTIGVLVWLDRSRTKAGLL